MAINHALVDQLDTGVLWTEGPADATADTISFGVTTSSAFAAGFAERAGWSALNAAQAAAARHAVDLWDELIAPDIRAASDPDAADVKFARSSTGVDYAHAYLPGRVGDESSSSARIQGSVWLNSVAPSLEDPRPANYGFLAILHEAGHTLGLDHGGDYNGGAPAYGDRSTGWRHLEDSRQYTIMSYFDALNTGADWWSDGWVHAQTPMTYDVLAIQRMYGADHATRAGDTVYGFGADAGDDIYDFEANARPVLTIWDGGGVDTLDLGGWSVDQRVNLGEGTYSDVGEGLTRNLAIAYGARIENAVGGRGDDVLRGNALDNRLSGGRGDDSLRGLDGDDVLSGGRGHDMLVGGGGDDEIRGGRGFDAARFALAAADYAVEALGGAVTLLGEGLDTVFSDVESFVFADATLSYDQVRARAGAAAAQPAPDVVAEAGRVALTGETVTVTLEHTFDAPVVFALAPSFNGADPVTVRLDDVTGDSFDLRLQETRDRDGAHKAEEVSFIVFEAGGYMLEGGVRVEIGSFSTDAVIGEAWRNVRFDDPFDAAPAVFSQLQTTNDASFAQTRQRAADASGFSVGIQEEEAGARAGGHGAETVGWFAIERGVGDAGGLVFEAGGAGRSFDETFRRIDFGADFAEAPLFLASLASTFGADPAGLRHAALDAAGVAVRVEEDTTHDREIGHKDEIVDWLALGRAGQLSGAVYDPAQDWGDAVL